MKLTELKNTADQWARDMLKAAGLRMAPSVDMSDTGDGRWIAKSKAEAAITALVAAGYKKSGRKDFVSVGKGKQGMTFDFDDPEDKGKVGLRFYGPVAVSEATEADANAGNHKLYVQNAYGNGYDDDHVTPGEMLPNEDGDEHEFVGVHPAGKKIIVKVDGKETAVDPKAYGGKITAGK